MCDLDSDEYIEFSEEDLSGDDFSDGDFFSKAKIIDITPDSPESPRENTQIGKLILARSKKNREKDYERMSRTPDFKKLEKYSSKHKIAGLDTKSDDWIVLGEGERESDYSIRRNITKFTCDNLKASKTTSSVLGYMISGKLIFNTSYGEDIDPTLNNVVDDISHLRGKKYMKSKGFNTDDSDSDSD